MSRYVLLLAIGLAGCDHPGEGPKAQRGYARSQPVIQALERYREEHRMYPTELTTLVPRYLPPTALQPPNDPAQNHPFEYRVERDSYELTFTYAGPGFNRCTYASATRRWTCRGAF